MRSHARRSAGALGAALMLATGPATALASSEQEQIGGRSPVQVEASVRLDPRNASGGEVAQHFVGLSIEWTLIDRYMGPTARRAFANLLGNLGSGVLRIGGSSQDQVPFDAAAPDSDRVVTPRDLEAIRATLDAVNDAGSATPGWL